MKIAFLYWHTLWRKTFYSIHLQLHLSVCFKSFILSVTGESSPKHYSGNISHAPTNLNSLFPDTKLWIVIRLPHCNFRCTLSHNNSFWLFEGALFWPQLVNAKGITGKHNRYKGVNTASCLAPPTASVEVWLQVTSVLWK